MTTGTKISWTNVTWNCVRGCSLVSEGCRNCYAMRQARRFSGPGGAYEGLVNKHGKWTGEVRLVPEHLADPLHWRVPRRVFVNSMSDLFHPELTNEQIAAVFGVMAACPQHTFQVLTKRPERMYAWFEWVFDRPTGLITIPFSPRLICRMEADKILDPSNIGTRTLGTEPNPRGWPLPNVWLGVSVEDQAAANERIPMLLHTPAAVRFLSCEPLLGPVDLNPELERGRGWLGAVRWHGDATARVDWVIAGCESGPGARPCEVTWLRSLRDQCDIAGVPFFLKQAVQMRCRDAGSLQVGDTHPIERGRGSHVKAGGVIELPYLDGEQHTAFPEVHHG